MLIQDLMFTLHNDILRIKYFM